MNDVKYKHIILCNNISEEEWVGRSKEFYDTYQAAKWERMKLKLLHHTSTLDVETVSPELADKLIAVYRELASQQVELNETERTVLHERRWELYE